MTLIDERVCSGPEADSALRHASHLAHFLCPGHVHVQGWAPNPALSEQPVKGGHPTALGLSDKALFLGMEEPHGRAWRVVMIPTATTNPGPKAEASISKSFPCPSRVVKIASSSLVTVVLLESGAVYFSGILPWGDQRGEVFSQLRLPFGLAIGTTVKRIAVGKRHILLLDDRGRVWSGGDNSFGQLGVNAAVSGSRPLSVIGALEGMLMRDIVCGGWHSLVLSQEGDVYSFGRNDHGQLGECTGGI
jgi:hypothetical protein